MTVYRFEPPDTSHSLGDLVKLGIGFVTDPLSTVLGLASSGQAQNSKERGGNNSYNILPVEVDDEWDTVKIDVPKNYQTGGRQGAVARTRLAAVQGAQNALFDVYQTGILIPGVPKFYKQVAAEVAKIGAAKLARTSAPAQDRPTPSPPGKNPMPPGGYIPPGGMAGFSQMTPSSQIALTRGARGGGGGGRRKRRTKVKRTKTRRVKRAKGGKRKAKRFVKGSAAAKRYMAKIRRKRR